MKDKLEIRLLNYFLLIVVYGSAPAEAAATSLVIQVAGMASGTIAYWRADLIDKRLSFLFF